MDVDSKPGTYVVAVSGGVDSMVLLDVLARKPDLKLIVAHYDHGIRTDSTEDRKLVQELSKKYNLQFVFDEDELGPGASEATAREARYKFLRAVRRATGADAILTAHHQDDVIETAIINMLRGTGRRGLTSMHSYSDVVRPLLGYTKQDILAYARDNGLVWHEDSTNQDTRYLRNYVRHNVVAKMSQEERERLLNHISDLVKLNHDIDKLVINHLHMHPTAGKLDRHWFIMLPHSVALEVLAGWLRAWGMADFDSKMLERLLRGAKTLMAGKRMNVSKTRDMIVGKTDLALVHVER